MDDKKIQAILEYIEKSFPGATIKKAINSPPSDSTIVIGTNDEKDLQLKVGGQWILDNNADYLLNFFETHKIAEILEEEMELCVLVGMDGINRIGRAK